MLYHNAIPKANPPPNVIIERRGAAPASKIFHVPIATFAIRESIPKVPPPPATPTATESSIKNNLFIIIKKYYYQNKKPDLLR